jgi:hypothetical protein
VLALEGVHGRRDLVGGLRVQGVEVFINTNEA